MKLSEVTGGDPRDFSSKYNTALAPQEEKQFQEWATKNNRLRDTYDYDMRGAWKDGASQGGNGHFSDKFKKPNHPTFSDQSQYNGVDGYQGGKWGQADGRDTFAPSESNLKNMSQAELERYFAKVEPNAMLQISAPAKKLKLSDIQQQTPSPAVSAGGDAPVAPQDSPSAQRQGSPLSMVTEPIAAIGGGMVNQAISGLSGLARLPQGADAAANAVRTTQEALPDFSPTSVAGQKGMKTLGDMMKAGIDIVNYPISGIAGLAELASGQGLQQANKTVGDIQDTGLSTTLGERALETTGSPMAATAAYMAPDAIMALASAKPVANAVNKIGSAAKQQLSGVPKMVAGLTKPHPLIDAATGMPSKDFAYVLNKMGITYENVADDVARLPANITPAKAAKAIITRKIKAGDTDGFLAGMKIADNGDVVIDDVAQEAMRQGFREGDVQMIKASDPGTARKMEQMLKIKRQTYANERLGVDMRPADVIGDSVLNRFDHIRNSANKARIELDNIAKNKLATKSINVKGVADNFFKELDGLDVTFDASTVPPKLNFTGSMISKDRTSQRIIKDVADLLAENKTPSALRAHKLKRQLDTMLDYNKKSAGGLTDAGKNVAQSMRRSLNDAVRAVDPDYAAVNDTLSKSLGGMNDFERILGPSIDIWAPGSNKAIGQDLRGLLSNRKSRVKLENAVGQIDDLAKELGGNFNDNLGDLVVFSKTLDDQFGAAARTSLAGEMEAAGERTARKLASGDVKGAAFDATFGAAAKKVKDMRGVNDQQAFRAIDALLKRNKSPPQAGLPTIYKKPAE